MGVYWYWMIRMPRKEFTRHALYMAVMDDVICRNELEVNLIGDKVIVSWPKSAPQQERCHLFLQMNHEKSHRQIQKEITEMEHRLRESRQCIGQPKSSWKLSSSKKMICDRPILVQQFLLYNKQRHTD